MGNPDRLTGLDSSFLHLEEGAAHMHVAACMVFAGRAPAYESLVATISDRLHLVPRYRQRLAFVPFEQGRPVWVDDPHFQARFHIRHTALPRPGGDEELKRLAGRVFSQALDRSRPLWELWLVEGLTGDRFALLSKTHHALVDGVSGVDIGTVLLDTTPEPAPVAPPVTPWVPRPLPTASQLLADALLERATVPSEIVRGVRRALRGPRQVAQSTAQTLAAFGAMTRAGLQPAPRSPFNVRIGPHRRFTWVQSSLADFKLVKNALGGTVNDVVLAAVAGGLGGYMREHGHPTAGVVLKALVPVSVRADDERGALGNRVAAMWVPLPVGVTDARARLQRISHTTVGVKESGQAVGAQVLTELAGVRAADDPRTGDATAGPSALLQSRRDQRAGTAVPAVSAGAPARSAVSARAARREHGDRDRDHELQRPDHVRADLRLRRLRRPRSCSPSSSRSAIDQLVEAGQCRASPSPDPASELRRRITTTT